MLDTDENVDQFVFFAKIHGEPRAMVVIISCHQHSVLGGWYVLQTDALCQSASEGAFLQKSHSLGSTGLSATAAGLQVETQELTSPLSNHVNPFSCFR